MWDYSSGQISRYGDDTTYAMAAAFLNDGPVEDWGCGAAYAKRFFKHPYKGVDWAPGFADVVADLRTYRSETHGILLRHVLEHNEEWERILGNALASADKLVVVVFTPFVKDTRVIAWHWDGKIPDISFRKEDLTERFPRFREETVWTKSEHGAETVFYVRTRV